MYFDNVIFNILLILGLIIISSLINLYLNRYNRLFMKYTSSLKISSKEIIEKYSKDENIKLESYPSRGNSDLDNYISKNKCIFINARHYYSTSIYTLARTIYFCSMSKIEKEKPKAFKFFNSIENIFTMLDVLLWGLIFIGLLLKSNFLIFIGIIIFVLSYVFVFINLKIIKKYYKASKEYLNKVLKDKKEAKVIEVIYRYEIYQYLLKPFLACVKLFPFLLSNNQKKLSIKEEYYER